MTAEELGVWITQRVDEAVKKLASCATNANKKSFSKLSALLKDIALDSEGRIKPTVANLKQMTKIRAEMDKVIVNSEWKKAVAEFTGEFQALELQVKAFLLAEFGNAFDPTKPVFEAIKENAVLLTRQSLLESGITQRLSQPLEQILTRSVTTGIPYADLIEQTRKILIENNGYLHRWVKQITADMQHQYSRNYIQTAAQGMNAEFWEWSGGTVADTRPFCMVRHGKIYHISEIKGWASQEWVGKNPQTTEDNILVLAGGYNCLHTPIPRSKVNVPPEKLEEFKAK